jgi:pimeloyl-ACP methyl ester carboxylesterase
MSRARPDLFAAYVGTGLFVHKDDGQAIVYSSTLDLARSERNDDAVQELEALGPPPYERLGEVALLNDCAEALGGAPAPAANRVALLLFAPRYTLADVRNYVQGYAASDAAFDLGALDLRTQETDFALPMFVIQGAADYDTPADLARAYFDLLTAPRKQFVLLEGAGHTALADRADAFLAALNEHVRPLATTDR